MNEKGWEQGGREAPSRGHIPEAKAVLSSPRSSGDKDRWERQWQSQWPSVCILQEGELLYTVEGRSILVYYKSGSGKNCLLSNPVDRSFFLIHR